MSEQSKRHDSSPVPILFQSHRGMSARYEFASGSCAPRITHQDVHPCPIQLPYQQLDVDTDKSQTAAILSFCARNRGTSVRDAIAHEKSAYKPD